MKICTKCGEMKPLEEFVRDKRCAEGRAARCKSCTNVDQVRRQKRRMADPAYKEDFNMKARARYAADPEAAAARTKRWEERHPERARASRAATYRRLKERDPDYHNRWYAANRELLQKRYRDQMQRYREEQPEAERLRKKRYRQKHPERVAQTEREKTYSRRAKMPFSPGLAAFMADLVLEPCAYCGVTENITVDHIVPLSRGGKHEASNLAPACFSCNSSKGAKPLEDWLRQRAA